MAIFERPRTRIARERLDEQIYFAGRKVDFTLEDRNVDEVTYALANLSLISAIKPAEYARDTAEQVWVDKIMSQRIDGDS